MRIENSFIPARGVGEWTERNLRWAGVTHWDEFDVSLVGAKTGNRTETFIVDTAAHLDDGNSRFFDGCLPAGKRWRLYENFRDETCSFDIEMTGLSPERDSMTTVSFYQDGETTTLVSGGDLVADVLREQFVDAKLITAFNGARFDVPFLETSLDVSIDVLYVDLMYPCRTFDLTGGLKETEKGVGIDRDRPDIPGCGAIHLWREYERGDQPALDTLISYNREGAVNLRRLMEAVTGRLHDRVREGPDADLA